MRNRFSPYRHGKKTAFDPEALERDEKLKNKNIKFYEKLLKVKRKRKNSDTD